ncbi:TPA: DNA replication and repair protein RecF, partial [bacterium]|nr:DNA replication and repair protein RecF [bacterium]
GVHKDDWNVRVNDIEIKDYASQGEQRMMVLIIKLSLAQMIKKKLNQQPILVLDDVLFELDLNKKRILKEILGDYQQTFITSCDRNEYENFNKEITLYKLVDGEIKKEERI